ncbi:Sybindin-like protein [Polychytrium aggregatum]|uniref:Sybindin-like protein n=1 Tax=Polychytrium aggregatum TaxID=110093 RepID=UPI0022FEC665|nr:Sybindin-like protein [Polychytrium aggregatum]KAI9193385.1 Sybindin-like protein [Polychytrium aggregatum]
MTIYNIYIFDRKCACIYFSSWNVDPGLKGDSQEYDEMPLNPSKARGTLSGTQEIAWDEEVKLVYGVIFSLRNFVSKLSTKQPKDCFTSYRTKTYKLHFFEAPSGLKIVMSTDPNMDTQREALQLIYSNIYVEYVVKNPLQGPGPIRNDLFKQKLHQFVRSLPGF